MLRSTPGPCVQRKLDELEGELVQMNGNAERLQKSFAELTELQLVLERAGGFFNDQQFRSRGTFEAGSASGVWLHGSLDCERAGLPEYDHTPACNCPMGGV